MQRYKEYIEKDKNINLRFRFFEPSSFESYYRLLARINNIVFTIVVASVRMADRNRRALARRNISGLSAFSLERMPGTSCRPPLLQHAINYANWSSGYRSGTAMHVNVRKDICFPSAYIRFGDRHAGEWVRTNTYVRAICTRGASTLRREISACERTRARQVSRYSYMRMHLKEILPDVWARLIRGYYRSILTF